MFNEFALSPITPKQVGGGGQNAGALVTFYALLGFLDSHVGLSR